MASRASLTGRFTAVKEGLGRELEKLSYGGPVPPVKEENTLLSEVRDQGNTVLMAVKEALPGKVSLPNEVKCYDVAKGLISLLENESYKQSNEKCDANSLAHALPGAIEHLVSIMMGVVQNKTERKFLREYKDSIHGLLSEGREVIRELSLIPDAQVVSNYVPCFSNSPLYGRGDIALINNGIVSIKVTLFGWGCILYLLGKVPIPPDLNYSVGKEITLTSDTGTIRGTIQMEGSTLVLAALSLSCPQEVYPMHLNYQGSL